MRLWVRRMTRARAWEILCLYHCVYEKKMSIVPLHRYMYLGTANDTVTSKCLLQHFLLKSDSKKIHRIRVGSPQKIESKQKKLNGVEHQHVLTDFSLHLEVYSISILLNLFVFFLWYFYTYFILIFVPIQLVLR